MFSFCLVAWFVSTVHELRVGQGQERGGVELIFAFFFNVLLVSYYGFNLQFNFNLYLDH